MIPMNNFVHNDSGIEDVKYRGISRPVSNIVPISNDCQIEENLQKYLLENMVYETHEGENKRVAVIQKLLEILKVWVKNVGISKGISKEVIENNDNILLKIFGSQRLGL